MYRLRYLGSDTVKHVFIGADGNTECQGKSVIDREKEIDHYHYACTIWCLDIGVKKKGKGKVTPLQVRCGPEGG